MTNETAKSASETVRDAQKRLAERGGGRFPTLTLSPDEMTEWEALLALDDGPERGKAKRALMRGIRAALTETENDLTADQVIDWIKRNSSGQ